MGRSKKPPREALERLLNVEKLSYSEIALFYDVKIGAVYMWLNRYELREKKVRAQKPCKCLTCELARREEMDGLAMLICGDEACFMQCDDCAYKPDRWCWDARKKGEVTV